MHQFGGSVTIVVRGRDRLFLHVWKLTISLHKLQLSSELWEALSLQQYSEIYVDKVFILGFGEPFNSI